MKALILYTVFVAVGATISALIGVYIEREVSETASLVVFLAMFFANFVVAWIGVILVMDRSLSNAYGRAEQVAIEREGRRAASGRAAA